MNYNRMLKEWFVSVTELHNFSLKSILEGKGGRFVKISWRLRRRRNPPAGSEATAIPRRFPPEGEIFK